MALREILLGPLYIARALATTFKHNTKPIVTIEYPERQKAVSPCQGSAIHRLMVPGPCS